MYILDIGLIKAFDTTERHQLFRGPDTRLDPDEIYLIKALLSSTALQSRLSMTYYSTFVSNHGTPLRVCAFLAFVRGLLGSGTEDSRTHLELSMRRLNTIVFAENVYFIYHDPTVLIISFFLPREC